LIKRSTQLRLLSGEVFLGFVTGDFEMADTEKAPSYALTLKGDGISISRDLDQATARAIVEIVLGGTPSKGAPSHVSKSGAATLNGQRISLREALDAAEAKRMPDKIVTIGEYLISHAGQEDFTRDDIRARFRAAGEATPGNFGRDFAWTVSNGWVAEDPQNPGHFYITQTGMAAIQAKFSHEVKKKSGFKSSGRRRRKGGSSKGN
jgi:hypothetical protein